MDAEPNYLLSVEEYRVLKRLKKGPRPPSRLKTLDVILSQLSHSGFIYPDYDISFTPSSDSDLITVTIEEKIFTITSKGLDALRYTQKIRASDWRRKLLKAFLLALWQIVSILIGAFANQILSMF